MDELRALREARDEALERCRQLTAALRADGLAAYEGVHLTGQARIVLAALMAPGAGLVTSARLMDRLDLTSARDTAHDAGHLGVIMSRLRQALRPTGATIDNVWGVGFTMTPASKALLTAREVV